MSSTVSPPALTLMEYCIAQAGKSFAKDGSLAVVNLHDRSPSLSIVATCPEPARRSVSSRKTRSGSIVVAMVKELLLGC